MHDDGAGNPTAGYGHKDNELTIGEVITAEQRDAFFSQDVAQAESTVRGMIGNLSLSQNEFDALTDLAFNVGSVTLNEVNSKSLHGAISAGDYKGISNNLKYTKATGRDGKIISLPGLKTRSLERQTLFRGNLDYNED